MTTPTPDPAKLFAPVKRINTYLEEALLSQEIPPPKNLLEAMKYAVLQGGKRIRPLLAWYCCEAVGAPGEASLAAGAAVEFIHAFSLVHDDLPALDNDDLRRGQPTLHKHAGQAMAILTGDALLNLAYLHLFRRELLIGPGLASILSSATARMIRGQVLDTLGGFTEDSSPKDRVNSVHREKTAALISASCDMGAHAGAEYVRQHPPSGRFKAIKRREHHPALECIDGFAARIGLMFQIVDDLLDLTQTADQTGKRTQKDAAAGKLTFPTAFGVQESREHVRHLRDKALQSLEPLGPPAQPLRDLCEYLCVRTQ